MKNILPVAVAKDTGRKIHCSFSFTPRLPVAGQNWVNAFTTRARAFRTDSGIDFFRATAATTIRAILPFSLRLLECFFIFSKFALKKATISPLPSLKTPRHRKPFLTQGIGRAAKPFRSVAKECRRKPEPWKVRFCPSGQNAPEKKGKRSSIAPHSHRSSIASPSKPHTFTNNSNKLYYSKKSARITFYGY